MHERNIRWGELVGGLLIVFCSAALVVSLWSQIARLPLAQLGLFGLVTMGLFVGGLYAHGRWRLPTTSRGLLIIATLLVPLNFLLVSAYGEGLPGLDARVLVVEVVTVVTVALFGALLHLAARVYAPGVAMFAGAGVLGLCAMQLVLRRVAGLELRMTGLWVGAALPLVVYVAVVLAALWRAGGDEAGRAILALLGVASFAAAMAMGLFVYLAASRLRCCGGWRCRRRYMACRRW